MQQGYMGGGDPYPPCSGYAVRSGHAVCSRCKWFLVGGGEIKYWLEMTSFWFVMVLLVTSNVGG